MCRANASLEHASGMVSTVAKTSIEARLTFTIKVVLDAVHTYPLGKDLLLELGSGAEVKGDRLSIELAVFGHCLSGNMKGNDVC